MRTNYIHKLKPLMVASAILFSVPQAGAQTFTTLYSFKGGADGAAPDAALTYHGGAIYGTTVDGGAASAGTIFQIDLTTGVETVAYSFAGGAAGQYPYASLTYEGTFFGTTGGGGNTSGNDTVFKFDPKTGVEKLLYEFQPAPDGAVPLSGVLYLNGDLYGTTSLGGSTGNGTIYKVDAKTHAETVLYSFKGGNDGSYPVGGLIEAKHKLYGTTEYGGAGNFGCVFEYDISTGAEQVLYTFLGNTDGANSVAGLLYYHGLVYGTTLYGGTSYLGTVFSLNLATKQKAVVYSFNGGNDGAYPVASVIAAKGLLYGTTSAGGASGSGTAFSVNADTGAETVLHAFGGADGKSPQAGLIFNQDVLYGTTTNGGTSGYGTVFRVLP